MCNYIAVVLNICLHIWWLLGEMVQYIAAKIFKWLKYLSSVSF